MNTGHSSFFLYELPVHLLCSFFLWASFQSQFSNSFRIVGSLYIFPDINPFHDIWVGNYFIHAYWLVQFLLNMWIDIFHHPWKIISLLFLQIQSLLYNPSLLLNQINHCPSLSSFVSPLLYFLYFAFSLCYILGDLLWSVFQFSNSLFCFVQSVIKHIQLSF